MNSVFKSCIKGGTLLSNYFDCPFGVRQGCQISPLSFSIFIRELSRLNLMHMAVMCIKLSLDAHGSHGIHLDNYATEVKALFYADDNVLVTDTVGGMRKHIEVLELFCDNWRMTVNINKTKIIVNSKGSKLLRYEKWHFKGKEIEIVSSYKYLGLLHLETIFLRPRKRSLFNLSNACSGMCNEENRWFPLPCLL